MLKLLSFLTIFWIRVKNITKSSAKFDLYVQISLFLSLTFIVLKKFIFNLFHVKKI